ncbi:unnamed protein product [Prunus brigantina]
MSKNMDKSSQDECGEESKKQGKAHWDDEAFDAFIKICVVETIAGNRSGDHFSKKGWKNVVRKFSEPILKFPHPPTGKYYLVNSGYPQMKGYVGPYKFGCRVFRNLYTTPLPQYSLHQPYDDNDELLPSVEARVNRGEEMVEEQNLTHRREMDDEHERIANLLMSS